MSVARAQSEVSSKEYVQWMAFYQLRREEEKRQEAMRG